MRKPRAKKVVLPAKLYVAISNYFAIKAAGNGMFPDKVTKENVCGDIIAAAPKFTVTIFPGLIELGDAKGRAAIITSGTLKKAMLFKSDWNLKEVLG